MTAETIDGQAVVVRETVALPITIEQAIREWEQYQELTRRLLDDSDYQYTGQRDGKRFKKKSAWRKYSRAFNLDDEVTFEQIERAPDGWPVWVRMRVKAIAPNGRHAEAGHECHLSERCCPAAWGGECDKRGNHHHCKQGCNPRIHWSHPGDVTETALTRAKNRAISDLIGAGEVSAEEMEGQRMAPPPDMVEGTAREMPADEPRAAPAEHAPSDVPVCACEREMVLKSGHNEKTGKDWRGFFCQTDWRGKEKDRPAACNARFINA